MPRHSDFVRNKYANEESLLAECCCSFAFFGVRIRALPTSGLKDLKCEPQMASCYTSWTYLLHFLFPYDSAKIKAYSTSAELPASSAGCMRIFFLFFFHTHTHQIIAYTNTLSHVQQAHTHAHMTQFSCLSFFFSIFLYFLISASSLYIFLPK